MSVRDRLGVFLAATIFGAASLSSCGSPHAGPKLIEADGVSYTTCTGVLALGAEGDYRNPDAASYEVVFTDADGKRHDLKRVRTLYTKDLPSDTPECARSH